MTYLMNQLAAAEAVVREAFQLGAELAKIAGGTSTVSPAAADRRFADPAWSGNPTYRRLAQVYLAWAAGVGRLADDLDTTGADWRTVERARFAAGILTSALATTNTLWGNPAALKRAFDTGGASLVRGFQNWLDDLEHNGGMPSHIQRDEFQVGRDLALTPGSVILRDELAELLQYAPTTEKVKSRPVLIVPPPIGRYYILDLRPGRSFVEHAVGHGLQTFMLSWRNPSADHGGVGHDRLRRHRPGRDRRSP